MNKRAYPDQVAKSPPFKYINTIGANLATGSGRGGRFCIRGKAHQIGSRFPKSDGNGPGSPRTSSPAHLPRTFANDAAAAAGSSAS